MSGLTPILDTLLTQVLGKKGDVNPARSLQPGQVVTEVRGASPERAPESDSRLDPRTLGSGREAGGRSTPATGLPSRGATQLPPGGVVAPGSSQSGVEGQSRPAGPQGLAPELADGAARTRLSQPAQLIARAQQSSGEGFPPTVRTPGLLLESSTSTGDSAAAAAQRLGDSIRGSGLFYESHLQRWYRGELQSSDLAREPQMRLWQQARSVSAQNAGDASASGTRPGISAGDRAGDARVQLTVEAIRSSSAPNGASANGNSAARASFPSSSRVSSGPQPLELYTPSATKTFIPPDGTDSKSAQSSEARESPASAPEERRPLGPELQERLQSIIRNQLELLGTPVLRWEGEVNDGFLMFMEINLRPEDEHRDDARQGRRQGGGEAGDWSTEIELELPQLGEMTVSMRRAGGQLSVHILSQREDTAALLTGRLEGLVRRLEDRGVESPTVKVTTGDATRVNDRDG